MSEISNCVADATGNGSHLVVAFASMEGDMVDQHFGSAQAFYVYDVHSDHADLIATKQFGIEKKDGDEDKLKPKMTWLVGSDIVYCGSIGGSATRQLISLGITPLQVTGGPDVEELIEGLQGQMNGETEFWLSNILKQKQKQKADQGGDRFELIDEEDWG